MTATELQQILGVEDNQLIAYGYNCSRDSIYLYFESGFLVRAEEPYGTSAIVCREDIVSPWMFCAKRWYENSFNAKLLSLLESLSGGMCVTPGGNVAAGDFIKF